MKTFKIYPIDFLSLLIGFILFKGLRMGFMWLAGYYFPVIFRYVSPFAVIPIMDVLGILLGLWILYKLHLRAVRRHTIR